MKKKIFALSTVALFAIGLAFYANNSSSVNVLSEDNIEALTNGEGSDGTEVTSDYTYYRDYGKIFIKHGKNATRKQVVLNTCESSGSGCLIDLNAQTSSEKSTNSNWANSVPDWAADIIKAAVIAIISSKK